MCKRKPNQISMRKKAKRIDFDKQKPIHWRKINSIQLMCQIKQNQTVGKTTGFTLQGKNTTALAIQCFQKLYEKCTRNKLAQKMHYNIAT